MPALAALVRDAVKSGRTAVSRRHVATGLVGGPSHLGVTLSPWVGSQPGETGVICLFTDLSRVVTLEEQLRLKDALARLGELTAGLAHEFRNGLATIHGYARLLDPAHAAGAPVDLCRGPACRDRYARRTGDELPELRPSRAGVAAAARPRVGGPARPRPTSIPAGEAVRVSGRFGEVDGDDVLLRQAFSNLMRNALEACRGADIAPRGRRARRGARPATRR